MAVAKAGIGHVTAGGGMAGSDFDVVTGRRKNFGDAPVTPAIVFHLPGNCRKMRARDIGPFANTQARTAKPPGKGLGVLVGPVLFRFGAGQGCPVRALHMDLLPEVRGSAPGQSRSDLPRLPGNDLPMARMRHTTTDTRQINVRFPQKKKS